MTFYETLYKLMKENHLTSKQLSESLKIGKNQIKYWKDNGNIPSGDTLIALSDYFDVSIDYLLGRTDDPKAIYKNIQSSNIIKTGDINGNNIQGSNNINIHSSENSDVKELVELVQNLPLVKRAEAIIYLNELKTKTSPLSNEEKKG